MRLMKRVRPGANCLFALIALLLLAPAGVEAQTGRTSMKAVISETVTLSVLPNFTDGDIHADVMRSGDTVRITFSAEVARVPVIRVPLLVRSNSSFKISAATESTAAILTQLLITDVRATGSLVSPQAISELNVAPEFDYSPLDEKAVAKPLTFEASRPFLVASGPRISLGGNLESRQNALQITVLVRLKPQSTGRWMVGLTFTATADSLVQ
jgi:hypothetical protein